MKIYDKYVSLKKQDSNKLYLFKIGIFYNFLEDDAKVINEITSLKLTSFGSYVKCSFHCSNYQKYMNIFDNCNLNV